MVVSGYPGGEPHVVDESEDVRGAEVGQGEGGHDEHPGGGGHLGDLDHGEAGRQLALPRPRVEQAGGGQQDPVNTCTQGAGSSGRE